MTNEQIDILNQAFTYIEENFRSPWLKVPGIAVYLSEQTEADVSFLLEKSIRAQLKERICSLRIQEAKRMLRETNFHIRTISQEVGFASSAIFNRKFLASENMTPTEYRGQSRQSIYSS